MKLLDELALTPDIFREDGYSTVATCAPCLGFLRPILMEEAVVRDLRGGGWSRMILEGGDSWHRAGRELVRKLHDNGRLLRARSVFPDLPTSDDEWAKEALSSHGQQQVAAIVAGKDLQAAYGRTPPFCWVEKLQSSQWWASRSCSVRLRRHSDDYLAVLRLPLRHANVLRFIDPHLDPTRKGYAEFGRLLEATQREDLPPCIEIHRVCYEGSGQSRRIQGLAEIQDRFRGLSSRLGEHGIKATIFVWDDFHDRYLISNLLGVSMSNGFDVSGNANERTTWTRISRRDREDVEREFDEATRMHELRFKFSIGSPGA